MHEWIFFCEDAYSQVVDFVWFCCCCYPSDPSEQRIDQWTEEIDPKKDDDASQNQKDQNQKEKKDQIYGTLTNQYEKDQESVKIDVGPDLSTLSNSVHEIHTILRSRHECGESVAMYSESDDEDDQFIYV